jgi:hypothetical protein
VFAFVFSYLKYVFAVGPDASTPAEATNGMISIIEKKPGRSRTHRSGPLNNRASVCNLPSFALSGLDEDAPSSPEGG